MSIIIQKFGGSSIANVERVKTVAQRVVHEVGQGNQVVVVVSAMAGVTNQLIDWTHTNIPNVPDSVEYDVVTATGEQVTSGLLALTLRAMGVSARSWLSWQLPIRTEGMHKQARITDIGIEALQSSINDGQVAVIAGFQGIDSENRLTTLGRGGSDITAVWLAQALGATRCDIYTDVDGVFTADPRIVPEARKLDNIAYEEMLELSWQGAKVLQPRSVEIAMQHAVPIRVLSSFKEGTGSLVSNERNVNHPLSLTGIASNRNITLFTLTEVPRQLKVETSLSQALGEANISFNTCVQKPIPGVEGLFTLMFSVAREDEELVTEILASKQQQIGYKKFIANSSVSKVAVVGIGMQDKAAIARRISKTLTDHDIEVHEVVEFDIKIAVILPEEKAEAAVRLLHTAFALDQTGTTSISEMAAA